VADVTVAPFDPSRLDETLALMRQWSTDHPELAEASLFGWQRCTRYLALADHRIVGHIAQVAHEFRYGDARPPVQLGWGITLVLDMADDATRKAAGRLLLKTCEDAPGLKYAAVGVVPAIEPAYLRRGHQINREANRYFARFFQPAKVLTYWKKSTALAALVRLGNVFYRPRTRPRSGTLERITEFLPQWDQTWDDLLRRSYEAYGKRDADYLNYKLAQPNRTYHAFLHRDDSGTIDGYVVYRRARHRVRDLDLVKICDFVGTSTAKRDMFAEAMRFAIEEAPGTYGIVGLSAVTDAREFRNAGMWVVRPYPVVLAAGVEGQVRVDFFDSDLDDLW
jgi:hypothetical protein